MPIKNESKYIIECLLSILSYQGPNTLELILVDDGSTDDTAKIISSTFADDSRIKVIRTDGIGKAPAYNLAYKHSSGDVFCLLGGDDLLMPEVLDARIKDLATDVPSVNYCQLITFSNDKQFNEIRMPKSRHSGLESGGCMSFNKRFGDIAFPIPSVLPNEDTWLVLCGRYFSELTTQTCAIGLRYRIHDGNSRRRGASFSDFQEMNWSRSKAYFYFYDHFKTKLTTSQRVKILSTFWAALGSYLGLSSALIFSRNLTLKNKIKYIAHSNRIFFLIKEKFYRYLVGH